MEQIKHLRGEIDNPLDGNWEQVDEEELEDHQLTEFENYALKERIVVWYDDDDETRPIKMSLNGGGRIKARVSVPKPRFLASGLRVLLETSKGDNPLRE